MYLHKIVFLRIKKKALLTTKDNLKVHLVVGGQYNEYIFWRRIIEQEPNSGYT